MKPKLYLFVGYPGAGKTTIARLIHSVIGGRHIWADHERLKMFGRPVHSPAENAQLYAHLDDLTDRLLAEGQNVIFDTNFNLRKDRDYLREIARKQHAEATLIWVTTPKELAKKRAVEQSDGGETRLFGNMSETDFERIASHLQSPDETEKVIKIDGTNIDEREVLRLLNL